MRTNLDTDQKVEEKKQDTSPGKSNSLLLGVSLAVVFSTAAFISGLLAGTGIASQSNNEASLFSLFAEPTATAVDDVDLTEFWRVWRTLDEKFASIDNSDSVTVEEKLNGAIQGMVRAYDDPYTVYLPPADSTQFAEDISGKFGGVGMEVGVRDGMITVIAPLPDSPAKKAGLLAGDVLVEIGGLETDDLNIDEAVQRIRGEEGTIVSLKIYREGEDDFLDIEVERAVISIPTLETEVVDGAFVIELYNFNETSEQNIKKALEEYEAGGYEKLILDLRGNPGGYLESAVAIASYFIPSGEVVVRERFSDQREEIVYRTGNKLLDSFNPESFVVLIDGGSASAAEILAGALAEHEIATTIGATTYGKGSVQELVMFPSDASLKVTIAHWLTPEEKSFSEGGLEPIILVDRTPQQYLAGEDPQLERALQWLNGDYD